jgi:hypothetical protein
MFFSRLLHAAFFAPILEGSCPRYEEKARRHYVMIFSTAFGEDGGSPQPTRVTGNEWTAPGTAKSGAWFASKGYGILGTRNPCTLLARAIDTKQRQACNATFFTA